MHKDAHAQPEDELRALGASLRNWGRWGPDDERGALNLITADAIRAASSLVVSGEVFDLGIPLGADGPQTPWRPEDPRMNVVHFMTSTGNDRPGPGGPVRFADDTVVMPLQAGTQWDALGHAHYDGQMWNGYSSREQITVEGLTKNSVDRVSYVAGRAVLLDIAALKKVDQLEGGYRITPADLDGAAALEGVEIQPGDILLIRTGWWERFADGRLSREEFFASEPGLTIACAQWLRDRDVAAVAMDNYGLDVVPPEHEGLMYPLHMLLIRDMGVTIGELFDLGALARACAADGRYEFLLVAPALKVPGAAGSPLNPIALR